VRNASQALCSRTIRSGADIEGAPGDVDATAGAAGSASSSIQSTSGAGQRGVSKGDMPTSQWLGKQAPATGRAVFPSPDGRRGGDT
jgi:hypothetical protein